MTHGHAITLYVPDHCECDDESAEDSQMVVCWKCERIKRTKAEIDAGRMTPDRAATQGAFHVETPIRVPTLRQVWREWRCARRGRAHGPAGFYPPTLIRDAGYWRVWEQECQGCGRFTIWSERRD